jgi:hypothetical protein
VSQHSICFSPLLLLLSLNHRFTSSVECAHLEFRKQYPAITNNGVMYLASCKFPVDRAAVGVGAAAATTTTTATTQEMRDRCTYPISFPDARSRFTILHCPRPSTDDGTVTCSASGTARGHKTATLKVLGTIPSSIHTRLLRHRRVGRGDDVATRIC